MIFIENLKNKKGEGTVILSMFIVLFALVIAVIGLDFASFYEKNVKVKACINRAVKGAALQVDTDALGSDGSNLSAKGIFLIHDKKAGDAFRYLLSENLGLVQNASDENILESTGKSVISGKLEILEFKVPNDYVNMPYEYYSPTLDRNYLIENPSVFIVLKFQVRSHFLKREYTFGKLGSAELINIAE